MEMKQEMQPDEMGELQKQAGKNGGGDITKLAQDIAQKMLEFKGAVDASPGTTDKDKSLMDNIMQQFVMLVEKQLAGNESGQDQEEESDQLNQVPSDAGLKGVPMGPQTRQ